MNSAKKSSIVDRTHPELARAVLQKRERNLFTLSFVGTAVVKLAPGSEALCQGICGCRCSHGVMNIWQPQYLHTVFFSQFLFFCQWYVLMWALTYKSTNIKAKASLTNQLINYLVQGPNSPLKISFIVMVPLWMGLLVPSFISHMLFH